MKSTDIEPQETDLLDDAEVVYSPDMAKPQSELTEIKSDLGWIKKIGWIAIAAIASVIVAAIQWYLPNLMNQNRELSKGDTREIIAPLEKQIAFLSGVLISTNPDAGRLIPEIMNQNLNGSSEDELKLGLQTISEISRQAKDHRVTVDPGRIDDVGKGVLDIGKNNPNLISAVWRTTRDLSSYRSFLNISLPHPDVSKGQPLDPQWTTWYGFNGPIEPTHVSFSGVRVPRNEMAITQTIGGKSNVGAEVTDGPAIVFVQGGNLTLDNEELKNIVFYESTIIYEGGPLRLDGVYFLNCTFDSTINPVGDPKKFGNTLNFQRRLFTAPMPISFSAQ